jgi:hypothetical protein
VTTAAGTAPVLPSTVTATMSDGTTQSVAVTWASVAASQYAQAGTFTVTGTIANSTVTATANVTVTAVTTAALSAVNVAGQTIGTGSSTSTAISPLNGNITLSTTLTDVNGNPIPNIQLAVYLSTQSANVSATSNQQTLTQSNLTSPVVYAGNAFNASYTVLTNASGVATISLTATSAQSETVLFAAPYGSGSSQVVSNAVSLSWAAQGTMQVTPAGAVYAPYSTTAGPTAGLKQFTVTYLPQSGQTIPSSAYVEVTTTTANLNPAGTDAGAYLTNSTGSVNAGTVISGTSNQSYSMQIPLNSSGVGTFYINENVPTLQGTPVSSGATVVYIGASTTAPIANLTSSAPATITYGFTGVPAAIVGSSTLVSTNPNGGAASGQYLSQTEGSNQSITMNVKDATGTVVANQAVYIGAVSNGSGTSNSYVSSDSTNMLVGSSGNTAIPQFDGSSTVSSTATTVPILAGTTDANGNITFSVTNTSSFMTGVTDRYSFYFKDSFGNYHPLSGYAYVQWAYPKVAPAVVAITDNSLTGTAITNSSVNIGATDILYVDFSVPMYSDSSAGSHYTNSVLNPVNVTLYDNTAKAQVSSSALSSALSSATDAKGNTVLSINLGTAGVSADHNFTLTIGTGVESSANGTPMASSVSTTFVTGPAPSVTIPSSAPTAQLTSVAATAGATSLTGTSFNATSGDVMAVPLASGGYFFTTAASTTSAGVTLALSNAVPNTVPQGAAVYDLANGSSIKNFQTGVALTSPIALKVAGNTNAAVKLTTVNSTTITLKDSSGNVVPATLTATAIGNDAYVSIQPNSALSANTWYTVSWTNGITDVVGNTITAGNVTFQTGSAQATTPTVTSSTPASNAANVDPAAPITVTFNEPMDATTLNTSNVTLDANGTTPVIPTSAGLVYNSTTNTLTIIPSYQLTKSTPYTLTINKSVQDATDTKTLANAYTLNFMTASTTTTAPTLLFVGGATDDLGTGFIPATNVGNQYSSTASLLNNNIVLSFNAPISTSTTGVNVTISNVTTNSAIVGVSGIKTTSVVTTFLADGDGLSITPSSSLVSGDIYQVTVTGLKDSYNNTIPTQTFYWIAK